MSFQVLPAPMNLDHVSHAIEFRSLGNIDDKLWVHYDPLVCSGHKAEVWCGFKNRIVNFITIRRYASLPVDRE